MTTKTNARSTQTAPQPATPSAVRKAITVFFDQYDYPAKVRKQMSACPRHEVIEDEEMRRSCGVAERRWSDVKNHAAVAPYVFKLPNGKIIFAHVEDQKRLSDKINLASQ